MKIDLAWIRSHGEPEPSVNGDWYLIPLAELAKHGEYIELHVPFREDDDAPLHVDAIQIEAVPL